MVDFRRTTSILDSPYISALNKCNKFFFIFVNDLFYIFVENLLQ